MDKCVIIWANLPVEIRKINKKLKDWMNKEQKLQVEKWYLGMVISGGQRGKKGHLNWEEWGNEVRGIRDMEIGRRE